MSHLCRHGHAILCSSKAIELNAFEEGRHKHVLSNLVAAYGIKLAPEPEYKVQGDPEWAFMVTGYSECIDSFFAFGLFESAKRSGFFPAELVDTFEPVMQEEARHILFFVNWVAWHRRTMPLWRRPCFELKVLAVWLFLIWERIGIARDVGSGVQDNNFTVTGAKQVGDDIDVAAADRLCLAENSRRMSRLRPALAAALCGSGAGAIGAPLLAMKPSSRKQRSVVKIRIVIVAALGLCLTLYLVAYVGLGAVVSAAVAVGWGGFAILCLYSLGAIPAPGMPPGTCCCRTRRAPACGFSCGRGWCEMPPRDVLPFSQLGGIVLGARAAILHGVAAAARLRLDR